MNVVGSSGWLEYFANGPNASFFAKPIEQIDRLIVPSLSLFEVFKRVLQQRNESDALQAVAIMRQGTVSERDDVLAIVVLSRIPVAVAGRAVDPAVVA